MKVLIAKVDLDTCLTALIMDVGQRDEIVVTDGAAEEELSNPTVLCIEAGGSGLVHLNNFDHHDPYKYFPPACRQAFASRGVKDAKMARLVQYVCAVDDGVQGHLPIKLPSLSNIFSGMLLVEADSTGRLLRGIELLKFLLEEGIDPFDTMPDCEQWMTYIRAKRNNNRKVKEALSRVHHHISKKGLAIGFLESRGIGGAGTLYAQGCDIVILYHAAFATPPVPKYTIAGNKKSVVHLLSNFATIEAGWGGRETIIASPRRGSVMKKEDVINIVVNHT